MTGGAVRVMVVDDHPMWREGVARDEGHLGVASSIRGRVAELGGTAELVTAPGEGTEWELRFPRGIRRSGGRP